MPTLTEILILQGHLPIEQLDAVMTDDSADESLAKSLVENGVITAIQLAKARAAQVGLPFVELLDYPVDRVAVSSSPRPSAGGTRCCPSTWPTAAWCWPWSTPATSSPWTTWAEPPGWA